MTTSKELTVTHAHRLLTRLAAGAAAAISTAAVAFTGTAAASPAHTPITVPAEYVQPLTAAARTCSPADGGTRITREFLAAQVYASSGFDQWAATDYAFGPAQLTTNTAVQLLRDVDGNGTASAYDIADAVDALATLNCQASGQLTAAGVEATDANIEATINGGLEYRDTTAARQYAAKVIDAATQIAFD